MNELEAQLLQGFDFTGIIGRHPRMLEVLKLVSQVADTEAIILIYGESGTGKELIAEALHLNSSRCDKQYIPINCGALPEHLLDSELFGHVKGAFTGALQNKSGWFERAHGGTIFLDEVSEMTPALQVKLLRVLQRGQYSPVGSTEVFTCNVRVVAATNKNLEKLVEQGSFREDLFYRLDVVDVELPPLRERKEDIRALADHFINLYSQKYQKPRLKLSNGTQEVLMAYDFPGNVRELENTIQRAVLLVDGEIIKPNHLPKRLHRHKPNLSKQPGRSDFQNAKKHAIETFERQYICESLSMTRGNIRRAAEFIGLHVTNLHHKLKKYDINPLSFR